MSFSWLRKLPAEVVNFVCRYLIPTDLNSFFKINRNPISLQKSDFCSLPFFDNYKIKLMWNQKEIKKIAKKYEIKLLLMFGSRVNKKIHQLSDIDIGVLFEKNQISFEKYSNLLHALQKFFPKGELDVAIINNADPLFLAKILENCQLLFGRKKDLARLKIYSFYQFCDYQKYLNLEEEFSRRFIREFH